MAATPWHQSPRHGVNRPPPTHRPDWLPHMQFDWRQHFRFRTSFGTAAIALRRRGAALFWRGFGARGCGARGRRSNGCAAGQEGLLPDAAQEARAKGGREAHGLPPRYAAPLCVLASTGVLAFTCCALTPVPGSRERRRRRRRGGGGGDRVGKLQLAAVAGQRAEPGKEAARKGAVGQPLRPTGRARAAPARPPARREERCRYGDRPAPSALRLLTARAS